MKARLKYLLPVFFALQFCTELRAQQTCAAADRDTLLSVLAGLRKTDSLLHCFQDSVYQTAGWKMKLLLDSIDLLNKVHDRVFTAEENRIRKEKFLYLYQQIQEVEQVAYAVIERQTVVEKEELEKEINILFKKAAAEQGYTCLLEPGEAPAGVMIIDFTETLIKRIRAASW